MTPIRPAYHWRLPDPSPPPTDLTEEAARHGVGERLLQLLWRRGLSTGAEIASYFQPPQVGLHDPALLPDAAALRARIETAARRSEGVLVCGDFDADGLTGLVILIRTLRRLGIVAEPYVPSRQEEGHGLSVRAVEHARAAGHALILTVDCGTGSVAEVEHANTLGIDVLITDHHRVPSRLPAAVAVVNPHRPDSSYPDRRLTGAGVAFKVAQLLLADLPGGDEEALDLADLATIGTVADVAPIVGENRSIARLGLDRLRDGPRSGIAALLQAAGVAAPSVDLETVAFRIAPRVNAAGRVGEAEVAARLLLTEDAHEATLLAAELETANALRRTLTDAALEEARRFVDDLPDEAVIVVAGPWPVGVIGLVAGRLAETSARPCLVLSTLSDPWRGSARSAGGFDLAAAFESCAPLFERFGGHPQAAGCSLRAEHLGALRARLVDLADAAGPWDRTPRLELDLVLRAVEVDYHLFRQISRLEPVGPGAPAPLLGVAGLTVTRVRQTAGGHTQLTLRKGAEVLDGIAFGRPDLATAVTEGDRLDVVARLASRAFGGFESLQLEIVDVASAGAILTSAESPAGPPEPMALAAGAAG